jgi:ABC-type antimicrobial peptide transport system permease subunit
MLSVGLAIGVPVAFWGSKLARTLIAGLSTASPIPICVSAALALAVTLLAAYRPAWRAARVDPLEALRYQ